MIVIMRDAVMPDCCNTCVCSEGYGCGITGTVMTTKEMGERPDWCPLEEQEPCEDTISRQAAIRWVKTECNPYGKPSLDFESGKKVIEHLEQLPSAQPERKTGRWIYGESEVGNDGYYCSECGNFVPWIYEESDINFIREYKFCPNCGANIGGEDG